MKISIGMIWRLRLKMRKIMKKEYRQQGEARVNGVPKYQSFATEKENWNALGILCKARCQCTEASEALKNPSLGMQCGTMLENLERLLRRLVGNVDMWCGSKAALYAKVVLAEPRAGPTGQRP